MTDVRAGDHPADGELVEELTGSAFAGELEPITVSLEPFKALGTVRAGISDLTSKNGTIPAAAVSIGYVQHRITRVTAEGSVYTIAPRLIIPSASCDVPAGLTRTFWLTVLVPESAAPGLYEGKLRIDAEHGATTTIPVKFTVHKGTLDPVDIPAGPFGHTIDLPWYPEESAAWNDALADRSLARLREYGFTTASGLPVLTYQGFQNGSPQLDFYTGDAQMARFRKHGFTHPVITYCGFPGLNLYFPDTAAMQAAGLSDYSGFVKAIFSVVQTHATQSGWLPIYWNLGDEPIGDDVARSAENAEAYRKAFTKGPPWFTGASSFKGSNTDDPHFRLAKALSVVAWNDHDEAGVELLHKSGGQWAFYNGGNRWTFGTYMYKAAKQFGMKYRLSWHWNACAGDPYYALDCREDDYAWCNATPDGELVASVEFERLREGLDDYRRLLTLERLVKEKPNTPAARGGAALLKDTLGRFKLGDRDLPSAESFARFRSAIDAAIEALR
jgi:hypothetical protein